MQMHIGAIRNNNTRMFAQLGPDSGFDSIGDQLMASPLAHLLDDMDKTQRATENHRVLLEPKR